jgi:hypothetical protein
MKLGKIFGMPDLNNTQGRQMVGHELAIEQDKSTQTQPRNQPGKRNL